MRVGIGEAHERTVGSLCAVSRITRGKENNNHGDKKIMKKLDKTVKCPRCHHAGAWLNDYSEDRAKLKDRDFPLIDYLRCTKCKWCFAREDS
jgi:formate hydrogenlyase subunit 6/NADH:ubiquinone oxidoreductase subunit I